MLKFAIRPTSGIRDIPTQLVVEDMRRCLMQMAGKSQTDPGRLLTLEDQQTLGIVNVDPLAEVVFNPNLPKATPFSTDTVETASGVLVTLRGSLDASAGLAIGSHNVGISLPIGAIVHQSWVDVITTFTSAADTATIAIGIPTDDVAGIFAAIAINDGSNPWDAGLHAGIQNGTVANFSNKTTAAREVQANVAVQALTAGVMNVFVTYFAST